jgi:hypothetical protein
VKVNVPTDRARRLLALVPVLAACLGAFVAPAAAGGRSDAPVETDVWLSKKSRLHFDLWSQRGLGTSDVEIIERNLNAVRRDVGRDLRVDDAARFDVIVTEAAVFHRYSGAAAEISGLFDGKIHVPIPSQVDERELRGTLWHEYTHAAIFAKTRGRCPAWLNEGIAMFQQMKVDPRPRAEIGRLVRDGKLPYDWGELEAIFRDRTASAEDRRLAYLQALAIAETLYARYRTSRVNDLIDRIGASGDVEAAFAAVLSTRLEKLRQQVVAHLVGR